MGIFCVRELKSYQSLTSVYSYDFESEVHFHPQSYRHRRLIDRRLAVVRIGVGLISMRVEAEVLNLIKPDRLFGAGKMEHISVGHRLTSSPLASSAKSSGEMDDSRDLNQVGALFRFAVDV